MNLLKGKGVQFSRVWTCSGVKGFFLPIKSLGSRIFLSLSGQKKPDSRKWFLKFILGETQSITSPHCSAQSQSPVFTSPIDFPLEPALTLPNTSQGRIVLDTQWLLCPVIPLIILPNTQSRWTINQTN